MKIHYDDTNPDLPRLWADTLGVTVTIEREGDPDCYKLTTTNPYYGVNVSEVSRGEGESDRNFYQRTMATAYAEISSAAVSFTEIKSREDRIHYELGLLREGIEQLTGQIDHFEFDPVDPRQLFQVTGLRKRMTNLCKLMAEAS